MKEKALLFCVGGCSYPLLELIWRGHTHISMALAGGICLCGIHALCNVRLRARPLAVKCLAGAGVVTGAEFAAGLLFNGALHMNVWDYSNLPLNVLGQVCLPFSLLWGLLTIPAMGIACACTGMDKK